MDVRTRSTPPSYEGWPEQGEWTYEDWAKLPSDGWRYEVIEGVLHMTPAPATKHQAVSFRLSMAMGRYVDREGLGTVYYAPVDVRLPSYEVPFQPDIIFIRKEREEIIGEQEIEGAPDLVVEILSPSNWPYDRQEKFEVYRSAGVPEYWIVDYRAQTVEVFVLEEADYELLGKWEMGDRAHSRALEGFEMEVARVFQR